MNIEKKKILDNPWINIGSLLSAIIIFTIFTMSAPDLDKAGLGGLANLFFPGFFGIMTILIYLVSRIFTRKYNWIISIIGIVSIGYLSVQIFFDKL